MIVASRGAVLGERVYTELEIGDTLSGKPACLESRTASHGLHFFSADVDCPNRCIGHRSIGVSVGHPDSERLAESSPVTEQYSAPSKDGRRNADVRGGRHRPIRFRHKLRLERSGH